MISIFVKNCVALLNSNNIYTNTSGSVSNLKKKDPSGLFHCILNTLPKEVVI